MDERTMREDEEQLRLQLCGVTRQNAAKLIHEWLLYRMREEDETDIRAALCLRDIYDCHACVNHVAQVYIKGIADCYGETFRMQDKLTEQEASLWARRAVDRDCRLSVRRPDNAPAESKHIRYEDLPLYGADRIVDVRNEEESTKNPVPSAVLIPLQVYCRNPYVLGQRMDARIVFVCEKGIMSRLAAEQAVRSGFQDVAYTEISDKRGCEKTQPIKKEGSMVQK